MFNKINNYLETLLERISLKKLLIMMLLIFICLAVGGFAISSYRTIYKTIYKERIEKLKYIDNFAVEIFKYQNSLVQKHQKTLAQAQKESIDMIKRVHFDKGDYIWIDGYNGSSVYHPIPSHSIKRSVDSQIRKIANELGQGYLQYKWIKLGANEKQEFTKVSYVEGYKEWGWIVGTGVYINDIGYLVADSMLDGIFFMLLFFLVMSIILRYIILRSIVKPIDNLAEISSKLANNDLSVHLPVSKSDTEIGRLNNIFNKFVELFKKEKKTADREFLLRQIIEKIRSSLSLEETLSFICEETAKLFDVQRSSIATYSNTETFESSDIKKEYKFSPELKNYIDGPFFVETANYWRDNLLKRDKVIAFDNIEESDVPDYFKKTYSAIGTKSIIGTSIRKDKDSWGTLVLSEYNNYRHWTDEEKTMLDAIADQIYIAINQAMLFETEKKLVDRERLIGKIISKAISTFDINQIKQIVKEVGIVTNADRCYFVEAEADELKGKPIDYDGEYLSSPDIKTIVGYNFQTEDVKQFVEMYLEARDIIVFDYEKIRKNKSELYEGINKYSSRFDLKSGIGIPFIYMDKLIAVLCIEYVKEKVLPSEDELDFLRILGNQTGMAFSQIQLYQNTKKTAERENFLRKIFEAMRSSLDISSIKNIIVQEIGKALNVDVCYIALYDQNEDYFYIDEHSEYKSSPNEQGHIGTKLELFVDKLKHCKEINFANLDEFIIGNNLQGSAEESLLRVYNIKSSYHIPIYYANNLLGYIMLDYTKNYKKLEEEDLDALRIISTQAGIAIHQANLYKITQTLAETEKFNRKILEILRNTLDKSTIKHLFVYNIGQYFQADRVFFIDYDSVNNTFIPVDKKSEYLSSPKEKSFVDYNWTNSSMAEYIQLLLEKRELKIFCWEDYIRDNPKNQGFRSRFEDANVKSSYNFPVIYEGRIIGYFCVEFTQNECKKLSEEDVNRIRSMCTQAGIALYHADLYLKAQDVETSIKTVIKKISQKIEEPVNNILETSKLLSQNEIERDKKIEYLNNIINSCNTLIELTKGIY